MAPNPGTSIVKWLDRFARKPSMAPAGESGRGNELRTGLRSQGYINPDEFNARLQGLAGIRMFDEMWRSDSDVRRALTMVISPISGATWSVEPFGGDEADDKARKQAALVEWALMEHMQPKWRGHVHTLMRVAGRSGFAPFEQVWEAAPYQGRQVLAPKTLALRLPRTIYWWQTVDGRLVSITQSSVTRGEVVMAAEDLVYYRVGAEGDNWEGESLLRPAYKSWKFKDQLELIEAIGLERFAVGIPTVFPPHGTDPGIESVIEALKNIRANSQGYIVFPGPEATGQQPGWTFRIETPGGAQGGGPNLQEAIKHHRDSISAALIQEFMRLGQANVGARATADVQADPFMAFAEGIAGVVVEDTINEQLVPRILALNENDVEGLPQVKCSLIDATSITELSAVAQQLTSSGILHADNDLEDWFRRRTDMPPADPVARKKREEQAQAQSELMQRGTEADVKAKENGPAAPGGPPGGPSALAPPGGRQRAAQTLSAAPLRPFHDHMALGQITDELDNAAQAMRDALAQPIHELVAGELHDGGDATGARDAMERAAADQLQRLYELGQRTLTDELSSQGTLPDQRVRLAQDDYGDELFKRAAHIADAVVAAVMAAIRRFKLSKADDVSVQAGAEQAGMIQAKLEATDAAAVTLNAGREAAAQEHSDEIKGVYYTSILDANRCANCADADDGILRQLDDPVRLANRPPNPHCLSLASGANRCRCLEFYVLKADTPFTGRQVPLARPKTLKAKLGIPGDWNPADHPRDEHGRFIISGRGAGIAHLEAHGIHGSLTGAFSGKKTKKVGKGVQHTVHIEGEHAPHLVSSIDAALKTATTTRQKTDLGLLRVEALKVQKAHEFHESGAIQHQSTINPHEPPSVTLNDLTYGYGLGGSTGAKLYEDDHGNSYVVKQGGDAGGDPESHIREEDAADRVYRALGVSVPGSTIEMTPEGPRKIAHFIDAMPLGHMPHGTARDAAVKKLREDFALDALLGNWDVNGMANDNVLVAPGGEVYRIDNGGSLRFRAQGMKKAPAKDHAMELDSMRDSGSAKAVFGGMTDAEVASQVHALLPQEDKILAELTPGQQEWMKPRFEAFRKWADEHAGGPQESNALKHAKADFGQAGTEVLWAGPAGDASHHGKTTGNVSEGVDGTVKAEVKFDGLDSPTWVSVDKLGKFTPATTPDEGEPTPAALPDEVDLPAHPEEAGKAWPVGSQVKALTKYGEMQGVVKVHAYKGTKPVVGIEKNGKTYHFGYDKILTPPGTHAAAMEDALANAYAPKIAEAKAKHPVGSIVKALPNAPTSLLGPEGKGVVIGHDEYGNVEVKYNHAAVGVDTAIVAPHEIEAADSMSGIDTDPAAWAVGTPVTYQGKSGQTFTGTITEHGITTSDGKAGARIEGPGGQTYRIAYERLSKGTVAPAGPPPPVPTTPHEQWKNTPGMLHGPKLTSKLKQDYNAATLSGLTSGERDAISSYTGSGYQTINPWLRDKKMWGSGHDQTLAKIADMDAAIQKAPPLPDGAILYRGIPKGDTASRLAKLDVPGYDADNAFMSTSTSEGFASSWAAKHGAGGTLLRIKVRKGERGLWVANPDHTLSSVGTSEGEIIMRRGASIKVLHKEVKNGLTILDVEVLA